MRVNFRKFTSFTVIAVAMAIFATTVDAQIRAYRVTDRQVQTLLNRIENRADVFKGRLDGALDRSNIDGTAREDSINYSVEQFEIATNRLKSNFDSRRSTTADVQEVLLRAAQIDRFMRNNAIQRRAQQPWNLLKADLNTLAGYYNVRADWNAVYPRPGGGPGYTVPDATVRALIQRLENNTDRYKNQMGRALNRSAIDGTNREDSVNNMVAQFESATNRLRENFNNRRSSSADAQEVFSRGVFIDRFMRNNNLPNPAENTWSQIRSDLNTLAGYYNVTANWDVVNPTPGYPGGTPVYTVPDSTVRALIQRLENNTDRYKNQMGRALDRGRMDGTNREDSINFLVSEFETATNRLRENFDGRRSSSSDAQEVFNRGVYIDRLMRNNNFPNPAENTWSQIRSDLNTLAGYYNVTANWDYLGTPGGSPGMFDSRISGTYRLNRQMSDVALTVIDRSIVNARYTPRREALRRSLERRLTSPENLAIGIRGNTATIATIAGQTVDFTIDGRRQTETAPNGRQMTVRAYMDGNTLKVDYEGFRRDDYFLTFEPLSNGRLRATRRVYIEDENESVTVTSIYDRVNSTPDWNLGTTPNSVAGAGFIIPNNTVIVASLNTPLSTKTARDGDRFTMTVDAPSQYNGAVIEGRVIGERSGIFSGRANMSLSFDTIRLRNGQTYQFAGTVTQVRETDGDLVSVNNEGSVRDSNQTTRTVTRAGIGAVLGAVIGAIAGGGEGAAIGAGIGAGAGAGTVVLQGRDNLELDAGTQFTITAGAPMNVGMN